MPETRVLFFRAEDGACPVLEWLEQLRRRDKTAYARCVAVICRLEEQGYELRRPTADVLRDGIRELRARKGRVNSRILYFFHGQNVAILAHALTKKSVVPVVDIDRAIERMRVFESDPVKHTYQES